MNKTLEYWDIKKFVEYKGNPRKNDHAVDKMAEAIKTFGFRVPMLAKSDGLVVDGHLRLKAARKVGLKELPVINADDMTDVQIKAFRISVNKMADLADWDAPMLGMEFAELKEMGFDLALTGFDIQEVGAFVRTYDPQSEEYTSKIDTPVYKITGEKPEIKSLFDESVTQTLLANIEASNISPAEKQFLIAGAQRHTVLNFKNIAEYYAHASKEMQLLMEQSALVVIDFNKAIEQGYIELSEDVANQFMVDKPEMVTEDE